MRFKHWLRLVGARRSEPDEYDFGWSPRWTLVPLGLSVALMSGAAMTAAWTPSWWPLALLFTLCAAAFFAGHLAAAASGDAEHAMLPMVRLLSGPNDRVLDAGCGAGRTTLALTRLSDQARVVAIDRFDAGYIAGGGESLLRRNLSLAGVSDRVEVRCGDLLQLPFADASFDSAASTHVLDHLGNGAPAALRELARVLKPGGRALVVVWVPSWVMFAICNIVCFGLTPPDTWLMLGRQAGLRVADHGWFNGMWFALFEKPNG